MTKKETAELRRRFKPDRSAITRICGCFVNTNREIVSNLDVSLGMASREEAEKFLGVLKKTLTGTPGRNLIDIRFSTRQVADSEEHRLLSALRSSGLQDREAVDTFCRKVMDALSLDCSYLILLACDTYDVPRKSGGELPLEDSSESAFRYIVCSICPVKDGRVELSYFPSTSEFHASTGAQVVGAPELGFLFPAFDDRAANLYGALYYTRKPEDLHQEFIDAVFHVDPPMSAPEQKEAFGAALAESLEDACSFELVQSVHEQLREKIVQHRESGDPAPLTVTAGDVCGMLADCGIGEEKQKAFRTCCDESFGRDAELSPANLIDSGRFRVSTPRTTITVDPEHSSLVHTRIIDGRKYILIPADGGVEINGLPCAIPGSSPS